MNLMFVVNDHYIEQLLVTLNSIFMNQSGEINVYVVTDGLALNNRRKLERFIARRGGSLQLKVHRDPCIDEEKMVNRNWNPIVYYKLYGIFGIYGVERILYLDCDVVVDKDLTKFYYSDLSGYYAAVVEDVGMEQVIADYETHLKQLMVKKGEYFNGGVMLLNLKKIREDMSLEYMLNQFEQYASLMVFNEQDLLNMLWSQHLLYVDARYNRIASDFRYRKKIGMDQEATIYHYTTNKPWVDWGKTDRNGYGWCVEKYLQYCRLPETRQLLSQVRKLNRGFGKRVLWWLKSRMGYNPYQIPIGENRYVRFLNMILFYRG